MTDEKPLGPQSTLIELFDELRPDAGMRVVPVTLKSPDQGKSDFMIVITGNSPECNVMLANLMTYVNEMAQIAQQKEADTQFVGTDGKPLGDEPSIIVP